jgi:hypothetical protein
VTLSGVLAQAHRPLRVVVSDQSEGPPGVDDELVRAVIRTLGATGIAVETGRHLPRRGVAEHRQALLDRATAPLVLYLDDDVLMEPGLVGRMVGMLRTHGCGFVGSAVQGLSHVGDVRPHEQGVEPWDGPVRPERVRPGEPAWERWRLHNAANLVHAAGRLGVRREHPVAYRVAWVGGCVLYDAAKLRRAGGFGFWRDLPPHASGEDVLAQMRVMERDGGCGMLPSGAYHLELPTTVPDRSHDAWRVLTA